MLHILLATSNPHKIEEVAAVLPADQARVFSLAAPELAATGVIDLPEPVEDADTFEGNALIKARAYARHLSTHSDLLATTFPASTFVVLADDSGLEVDALNGAPGIYSARYSGDGVDGSEGQVGDRATRDLANNSKLLKELAETPSGPHQADRTARFVCALASVPVISVSSTEGSAASATDHPGNPNTCEIVLRGTFEGSIITPDQAADPASPAHGRGANGFGYDPLFLVAGLDNTTSAELTPEDKNARSHRGDAVRKWWALWENA